LAAEMYDPTDKTATTTKKLETTGEELPF